jgi:hypothetical protein
MSAYQEWKKNLGTTRPWDLINPNVEKVDDAEESMRYSMCSDCPEFIKLTTQCKQCGCIMKMKVKLKAAVCPIGKW